MSRIDAAIAIVVCEGKILVCQRKADDVLGGYWEFPGGKCEDGETLTECLARELREEVGITVTSPEPLTPIDHHYDHGHVRLHPFVCQHEGGEPQLIECQAAKWIDPCALVDYRFPPANEGLIEEVMRRLRNGK